MAIANHLSVNICVIGCGAIGTAIAREAEGIQDIRTVYLTDRSQECATRLQEKLSKVRYVPDIVPILSDIRLVVEAASQDAARYYAPLALSAGIDVLMMSVGVLADEEVQSDMYRLAKRKSAKVYVPSGAIGGIDALSAGSIGEVHEVRLTTTKPPSAFADNAYLNDKGIEADKLRVRTPLFEGSAREVGPPRCPNEKGVAGEQVALRQETDRSRCVAGGVNHLKSQFPDPQGLLFLKPLVRLSG